MKKILTWILSIAMVLTMMPVMGAQAKDPVRVIKLDKDMTLTEPVMVEKLGKNVVLDLNGYKIEGDFDCQGLCIVDNIGERNAIAAKEKLKTLDIRLIAKDTGNNYGRTFEFMSENGDLHVKTIGKELKVI